MLFAFFLGFTWEFAVSRKEIYPNVLDLKIQIVSSVYTVLFYRSLDTGMSKNL